MPICSIERITYGVSDLAASARFYDDFGLKAVSRSDSKVVYRLDEGSKVILLCDDDPSLPTHHYEGSGVREVTYGVDAVDDLEHYAARVGVDRDVRWGEDGQSIHFIGPENIPLALRVWRRKPVLYAPDPVNAPDNVKRLNQHRRWRVRAKPKTINHVVWRVADMHACMEFWRDRLDFRMTDYQVNAGIFVRPEGANQHHTNYFQRAEALPPFTLGFDHVCFGVEDIDEILAGSNYMERRGYTSPLNGVGRHRIASALFCYFDNPAGGMAEYGADTDYLDDQWVPRVWEARFGAFSWTNHILPFLPEEVPWEVSFDKTLLPDGSVPEKFVYPEAAQEEAASHPDEPAIG
ncbi:VOC family protein [Croceicoccus bisphenolivorans]|uniref:VOC family protein n=1 Tax=Croceicoccus bisphenolivorans TaxID=1783232 RepID=UPI00082AADA1|nr:VOC family protein [Croceicoccus bisphenolivorans]